MRERITFELFEQECSNCGLRVDSYVPGAQAYGWLVFRTMSGEVTIMQMIDNPVYSESLLLIDSVQILPKKLRNSSVGVLLSETIDRAPEVGYYYYYGYVPCPRCDSVDRNILGLAEPHALIDCEIEFTTHTEWSKLTWEAKREIAKRASQMAKDRQRRVAEWNLANRTSE